MNPSYHLIRAYPVLQEHIQLFDYLENADPEVIKVKKFEFSKCSQTLFLLIV